MISHTNIHTYALSTLVIVCDLKKTTIDNLIDWKDRMVVNLNGFFDTKRKNWKICFQ